MVSGLQKRAKLQKKHHKLNSSVTTNFEAVKGSCIILDTILHIYKLKLKLEAIKREYQLKNIQEVKVEKYGENFQVNINCQKGQNVLVSILETFEEMGLNVTQANVSCKGRFLIFKAIVRGREQEDINAQCIEQAVHKAIDKYVD